MSPVRRLGPGSLLFLGALLLAAPGCRSTRQNATDQQRRPVAPTIPVEQVAAGIARHNARVGVVTTLNGRSGVLELKWIGPDGKERFEPQVNADLWVIRPDQVSLRARKFGDVLFWMGAGPDGFWIFDLMSEPTHLYEGAPGAVATAGALALPPAAIVDLLGLSLIAPEAAAGAVPDPQREPDVALVTDGTVRYRLHLPSGVPYKVECLRADGSVLVQAALRWYEAVEGQDAVQIPTLIDLEDPAGRARLKLVFPTITTDTNPRAFDRAGLRTYLKPARVEPISGDL